MFAFYTILYLLCSLTAYGLILAYYQREWPEIAHDGRWYNFYFAIFVAAFGPLGFIAALSNCGYKHGLLFWPESKP